jgi:transcription elongation factor GreA
MATEYFTEEGLKRLKDELHHLVSVERPSISNQIAEARDKGDLSENAEYDAAKEAQGLLELKISQIEQTIRNAKLIDESKLDANKILILSKVTIKNTANGSIFKYELVPQNDADVKVGKISVDSPIGKGLLGKKIGDTAEITVPSGSVMKFEILEISR